MSYNIIAWLITSVLIALGLWQISLNRKIYYSKMLLWLSLGCIFLVIPVFYQFEFTDHAIPRILALIGGLLFLFSLYQFKLTSVDLLRLLLVILLAVIIEACFALIQFFLLETGDWGGYRPGISRPHGVFLQPNVMASFMATGLAIAAFLSIENTKIINTQVLKFIIVTSLFLSSFLLVLLQSRTGFVAAIIVLLLTTPYLYQKNKKQLGINLSIVIIAIFSAFICLENSDTPVRGEQVYETVGPRHIQFAVSLAMIEEKPIMGYGYGGFERSFLDYFNQQAIKNPELGNTITHLSHPHNEVLFWVVEGGVVALLAFILFTLGYLTTWLKIPLQKALMLLALLFPMLLHSQLEFPFYSSVSHWLVFLIVLYLTDFYALANKTEHAYIACPQTFLIRFFALFIPSIFIPFLVTTLHTANILVEHEKNFTRTQSITRLKDIINPIAWQSRLDAAVYAHILVSGLHNKDTAQLESYLKWALKRMKHKPRKALYSNALLVLKVLDRPEDYQVLLKQAKRTYPQQGQW